VCFRSKYEQGDSEILTNLSHNPKALLVVGPSPSHEYFYLMISDCCLELLQSSHDSFKCCSNVGEVSNSSSNDEDLPILMLLSRHHGENSSGVVVCLLLGGGARVFTIVSKLSAATESTDCV